MQDNRGFRLWKVLLITFFFLLCLLPVLNRLTLRFDTGFLNGVENNYQLPEYSWSDYYRGDYQSAFENSFGHGFTGVRTATRLYNELRFRLFRQSDDNTVVCKDGSVIFESYVLESLGLDPDAYCSDEFIDDLVSQLGRLSELAEDRGKTLLVVITPNKADFIRDVIPDRYYRMQRVYAEDERGVHKLTAAMDRAGVPYVDGSALLLDGDYPFAVFPQTGIHYTPEAALEILSAVTDALADRGVVLKRITVEGREYADTPRRGSLNNDDDVWMMMNVFSTMDTQYSYPIVSESEPEYYDLPRVFIQGGSFSYSILEQLRDHEAVDDVNFLFYAQSLYNMAESPYHFSDFSDPAIYQCVADSNVILLEVNVAAVAGMGSGFYPTLESILSGDLPPAEMRRASVHDFRVTYENARDKESANGVTWRWSLGKSARVVFHNVGEEDEIELSYWVPYSMLAASNPGLSGAFPVEVLLNGEPYQTDTCAQDAIFTIRVSGGDRLPDGTLSVEIVCPYSFDDVTPNGERELAFQILTAGRVN